MESFSRGWQSYNFKAGLRSRFSRALAQQDFTNVSRPPVKTVRPNATFVEGVATKDVMINETTGLTVRIFLPSCAIQPGKINEFGWMMRRMGTASEWFPPPGDSNEQFWHGANGGAEAANAGNANGGGGGGAESDEDGSSRGSSGPYNGYVPNPTGSNHQLPVIVQFHDGAFVTGSKDSAANDTFCRRIARVCNSVVVAVGYRLAPEHKCPAAYDDGYEVLKWLSRQAILADAEADVRPTMPQDKGQGAQVDALRGLARQMVQELPDPWLAAHADVHRCILLGVSSGANIADQVARRCAAPSGASELSPLGLNGQVLLYPLFAGSMPTPSELKTRDAYFFDRATCDLVFRLFLPSDDFSLDHPAVNPLLREHLPPAMPPTLLVVADLDILTDRAIAYSVFLRNFGIDVQVNSYKDMVHGFATFEGMVNSPQAEACAEDIAMWVTKHVSLRGDSELSY